MPDKILDHTPFLLAHLSRDLRYIYVSKSYAMLIGQAPDDLIGKRVVDIIGAAGFEQVRPYIEAVLRGERVEHEAKLKIANREPRHYHVSLVPERDEQNQVVGYIASIIDITERKLSQETLAAQLEAMQSLQAISTQLLGEESAEALYQKVMDAAISIMHSDFASLQVFDPQKGPRGQLHLLAYRGFNNDAERLWKWVTPEAKTTCAEALRTGQRVIVPDVKESALMAGSVDLEMYLATGVRAVQTTPLVSRAGHLVGMISTLWRYPHHPRQQDLLLLDVLARQAADLIERSLTDEHTRLLVREVGHRAKNLLAVVQGIVQQTLGEGDSQIWAQTLSARLAALSANQTLLVESNWRGVEIGELIRSQLTHLSALVGTRIMFDGPSVPITPSAAQTLSMAFHELATNAVKYGALSNGTGHVSIGWALTDDSNPRLVLNWRESKGPAVVSPRRRGFGTEVMVQMVEHALDADVALDYDSLGVHWRVSAPKATVIDGTRSGLASCRIGEVA